MVTGAIMERIRPPGITPLEVWDLWLDEALFGELTCSPEFPAALRRSIEMLHAGRGTTKSAGPAPSSLASGFDAVFLAGGRVSELALRKAVSGLPFPVFFGEEGLYAGASGGFELLRQRDLSGWVADLGQSHFKIAAPQRHWVFPRDWSRLREPPEVSPCEWPVQRRRLREFIALRLQMTMADNAGKPSALVFALPTRLADDGTPAGSNYAGMRGDRMLLPEALDMAGLGGVRLFVLNDAELAALSALTDVRLASFRKVLVLTLGFGIGAALIQRA